MKFLFKKEAEAKRLAGLMFTAVMIGAIAMVQAPLIWETTVAEEWNFRSSSLLFHFYMPSRVTH